MPRFSVVIPTYNRSAALRRTVDSVLRQTYTDFEAIVVDDGSTDDTKAVLEEFCDSRILYFRIPNSGGPATPRNLGIDKAGGDWICLLDSDDLWFPSKLEVVDKAIREDDATDGIYHNLIFHDISSSRKTEPRIRQVTPDFYRTLLVGGNRIPTSGMTVRKAFLETYRLRFNTSPEYVIVEDYDLWLRMAFHDARFLLIESPLGEYLIEEGSISNNTKKYRNNLMHLLVDHVFRIQNFDKNRAALWRTIQARVLATWAVADLRSGSLSSSTRNFAKSFWISPKSLGKYILSKVVERPT